MPPGARGVLLGENCYRGVTKFSNDPSQAPPDMSNFHWLTPQRVPVADTPPVVVKTTPVVAYGSTLRSKLTHKDGAGLPPQGRTVRAGVALPPGDARLLFCAIVRKLTFVAAEVSRALLLLLV
jgi:hypothetical protein